MQQWGNSTTGMGIIKAWKWGKLDYRHGDNKGMEMGETRLQAWG